MLIELWTSVVNITLNHKQFLTKLSCFARERSKLREEIVARRQKKLLMRHARKKCLEEAALREMELLQELDGFLLDVFLASLGLS